LTLGLVKPIELIDPRLIVWALICPKIKNDNIKSSFFI